MSPLQPIPTPEKPPHQGLSFPDVQALGLILLILMVINLPLYQTVLQRQDKQAPGVAIVARPTRVKTALVKPAFPESAKPNVPSLTKKSGTSNSKGLTVN